MRVSAKVFAWVGLILAACGDGNPGEQTRTSESPILSGAQDSSHPAVVALKVSLPTGDELCSAYLITPDLVLTARHCAAPINDSDTGCVAVGSNPPSTGGEPLSPDKITVLTDASISAQSIGLPVAEVSVLPNSTGATLCGNDLALLRLVVPITTITPIALRLSAPPELGDTFVGVGYGATVPGGSGDDVGVRRFRNDLSVESVGASTSPTAFNTEWKAMEGPCGGDSGSPALGADGASFGVMSRGLKTSCEDTIYERLDVHAVWLASAVRASATRLGTQPPTWANVTEDADAGAADSNQVDASTTGGGDSGGCAVGMRGLRTRVASVFGLASLISAVMAAAVFRRRHRAK